MFLRYRAQFYDASQDSIRFGVFWAADYLKNHGTLAKEDRARLEQLIHWFDHELPIPEYYQDEKNRKAEKAATSWFKDSAQQCIRNMNELTHLLEQHQVVIERIHAKKLPGKIIYEDDYQVTILPFREGRKQVR